MVTLGLLLNVMGMNVPGVTMAPDCCTPTVTALNVVGVVLQRLEKVNLSELPPTATVAMSRVVEFEVTPTPRSVGDVQVVCQAGEELVVAEAGGLDVTAHPVRVRSSANMRTNSHRPRGNSRVAANTATRLDRKRCFATTTSYFVRRQRRSDEAVAPSTRARRFIDSQSYCHSLRESDSHSRR
jgi:hypothetical protein